MFSNDNKKIGLVVNVIFSTDQDFPLAKLLVFPDTTKGLLDSIQKAAKDNALDIIKDNFPADYPKVKAAVEKVSAQGIKILDNYLKNKEKELMETCYLVPLEETENPGQDVIKKIKINHNHEDCDQFRSEPDEDIEFPFFRKRSFTGVQSLLTTTLNLEPVEGLKANLPNAKKGRTVDLELDYDGGLVNNLIVKTYGAGAAKHLVCAKAFDFSELKAKQIDPMPTVPD